MGRRFNPNLAKIHRNYTVEAAAVLFGVHRNTVRNWVKAGLPTIDDKRPILILGSEYRRFLQVKRTKNKHTCKPNEFFCVRCKAPKIPVENRVECETISSSKVRLIGICPTCTCIINKFTSLAKLEQIQDQLDITLPKTLKQLNEIA